LEGSRGASPYGQECILQTMSQVAATGAIHGSFIELDTPVPSLERRRVRVLGIIRCMTQDMNKQSLYFPEQMLKEIEEEAKRLERSKSWVVAHAWKLVREKIRRMSASDPDR